MVGSKQSRKDPLPYTGATALSGIFVVIACAGVGLLYDWLLPVTVLTGCVFWAVLTTFRRRWRDSRLWKVAAVLFLLHLFAMSFLLRLHVSLTFRDVAVTGVIETIGLVLVVAVALGGRDFLQELQ